VIFALLLSKSVEDLGAATYSFRKRRNIGNVIISCVPGTAADLSASRHERDDGLTRHGRQLAWICIWCKHHRHRYGNRYGRRQRERERERERSLDTASPSSWIRKVGHYHERHANQLTNRRAQAWRPRIALCFGLRVESKTRTLVASSECIVKRTSTRKRAHTITDTRGKTTLRSGTDMSTVLTCVVNVRWRLLLVACSNLNVFKKNTCKATLHKLVC